MTGESVEPQGGGHDLVPLAGELGGALVTVLNWPQYAGLDQGRQLEIALVVDAHPSLNTEGAVDLLAHAAMSRDQEFGVWWEDLLGRHDLDEVILALNTLDELGWRAKFDALKGAVHELTSAEEQLDLEDMLELMAQIEPLGYVYVTPEALAQFIEACGGWDLIRMLNSDQILDVHGNPRVADELKAELMPDDPQRNEEEG